MTIRVTNTLPLLFDSRVEIAYFELSTGANGAADIACYANGIA